jgi:hypothetical protein
MFQPVLPFAIIYLPIVPSVYSLALSFSLVELTEVTVIVLKALEALAVSLVLQP